MIRVVQPGSGSRIRNLYQSRIRILQCCGSDTQHCRNVEPLLLTENSVVYKFLFSLAWPTRRWMGYLPASSLAEPRHSPAILSLWKKQTSWLIDLSRVRQSHWWIGLTRSKYNHWPWILLWRKCLFDHHCTGLFTQDFSSVAELSSRSKIVMSIS